MEHTIYDVLGVGFGPANIALAIAMEENEFSGTVRFFDTKPGPSWQEQMLLPGSDIQNNPLRDLVTPRNPRSRYSFTNFLFENDRLFEHFNLGMEFPLRREYAEYVQWVAQFFSPQVSYDARVESIRFDEESRLFELQLSGVEQYLGRSVVVAPGQTPRIPTQYQGLNEQRVFHLTQYQQRLTQLAEQEKLHHIAVVGGSQSAVEIMLDLHQRFPDAVIHNLQRGYGFRLKDTSHFSEHVYFPSFVDYYFDCSPEAKKRINSHLHYTNYSAADGDVIHQLYVKRYEDKLSGVHRILTHPFCQVDRIQEHNLGLDFTISETNTGAQTQLPTLSAVILATGFRDLGVGEQAERCPSILGSLYGQIQSDPSGVIEIARDYRLMPKTVDALGPLYLNGLCESSHGYGDAGSFSLLALRSQEILNSLLQQLPNELTKTATELVEA